jgi:hypothetical protein
VAKIMPLLQMFHPMLPEFQNRFQVLIPLVAKPSKNLTVSYPGWGVGGWGVGVVGVGGGPSYLKY